MAPPFRKFNAELLLFFAKSLRNSFSLPHYIKRYISRELGNMDATEAVV